MSVNTNSKGIAIMLTIFLMAFIPWSPDIESAPSSLEVCNGSVENCEKSYTDVTFAETHNSHATIEDGFNFLAHNHRNNISHQWDAGFRAFMLDIHHSRYSEDMVNTSFCHGTYDMGIHPCVHGSQNAVELLTLLKSKMVDSPNDIVTLLFEVYVPYSHIEYILNESGLLENIHVQTMNEPWPTLRQMGGSNENLVVFIEGSYDEKYPFLHNFAEHGWSTNYGEQRTEEMNCDPLRGDPTQPVYHMNNWLSLENGLSDYSRAPIVNAYDFLLNRSLECWEEHGAKPTFIAVDWWTDGETVNVTRTLNEMTHWSDSVPLRATTDSR